MEDEIIHLQETNTMLEEENEQLNADLLTVRDEAEANEDVLMKRIQFLSEELESHETENTGIIAQLDSELRAVAIALDRVTVERDELSDALLVAAREKVSALVKVAELSGLMHMCLKKFDPNESRENCVDDSAQSELLSRFQASLSEKLDLQFRLQDSEAKISRLQSELAAVTHDRDVEGDHSRLLSSVLESRENECSQLAEHSQEQTNTLHELHAVIARMERNEEAREEDIQAMSQHLSDMRERLDELQEQASRQDSSNEATEDEMRKMFEERVQLLQRQMDVIGELASSEFTMIGLSEELDAAQVSNDNLRSENEMLSQECERLRLELSKLHCNIDQSCDGAQDSFRHIEEEMNGASAENDATGNFVDLEDGEIVSPAAMSPVGLFSPTKQPEVCHILAEADSTKF